MKITNFLLIASFFSGNLIAQTNNDGNTKAIQHEQNELNNENKTSATILDQYIKRATQTKLIEATNGTAVGYPFGTYSDQGHINSVETGVHYDGVGSATVNEILVYFGAATVNGTSDTVLAYIYDVGSDSMPTTVLGSGKLAVDAIICINQQPTAITINGGANVTGAFLVSINYKDFDDMIGVYSNNPYINDGKGENRTRGLVPGMGGGWMTASQMWGSTGDCDVYIVPVLNGTNGSCTGSIVSISEPIHSKGLTLMGAFPNPAINKTVIKYLLEKDEKVEIKVFDLLGKTVYEFNKTLHAGAHQIEINTSELIQGNFYYTIATEQTQMTSKFVVTK